jgi:hypothetical protein
MKYDNDHDHDCAWTRADCTYKLTHYYCPHPEHACDYGGPTATATVIVVTPEVIEAIQTLADAGINGALYEKLVAHNAKKGTK